ncbi:hypothetical protein PR202_ga07802 [Eleusine coracana subsp. coracana]|uniref:Uncharacterized protein n=1 Tax=Eleusine coracana subsp. coracana TaxID=191504 RepID=A0AAV5BZM2_ELECO|nr:hypothetical protein PR202_ga07802 [Eleusine coracana subsp. coracana]
MGTTTGENVAPAAPPPPPPTVVVARWRADDDANVVLNPPPPALLPAPAAGSSRSHLGTHWFISAHARSPCGSYIRVKDMKRGAHCRATRPRLVTADDSRAKRALSIGKSMI